MTRLIRDYFIALLVLILALAGIGHHGSAAAGHGVVVICGAGGPSALPFPAGGPVSPQCPECLPGSLAGVPPPVAAREGRLTSTAYDASATRLAPPPSLPIESIRGPPLPASV